jgi:hypothetical protein
LWSKDINFRETFRAMRNLTLARSIAALGTLAIAAWGSQAYAVEPGSADPHLPGVSDGVPAGALPPPGFYFVNTTAYNDGSLQDGNGNPTTAAHVNATAWITIPGVTWVTPLHLLGASYAVAIAQPLVTLSVTGAAGAGVTQSRTGVFNTVIVPAILSWHLPMGFFVSGNFAIYLPDGDNGDRGNGTNFNQHIANNTTTFAPGGAVSWFNGHGLETSLNVEYDIQTQNSNFVNIPGVVQEKFQSGDLLNLDFTAVQVLPGAYKKWTVGAVGFWSVQTTDDQITVNGTTSTFGPIPGLLGSGNKFQRFGLGPYVGYDFGPIGFNFWYTRDIEAKNAALGDTFFFRFALPL